MKTKYSTIKWIGIYLFILFAAFTSTAAAETYTVDPVHSSIVFRIKHLGVAYFYGRFINVAGTIVFDDADVSNSSVNIHVKSQHVDTFNGKRDNHLRSEDFFHADKYPLIEFKSKSVKRLDQKSLAVTGDLTLRGATRPLAVRVHHTGSGKDPWGNYRTGFETEFTIMRSEFGMDYMSSGLGDDVKITVSVEGIRK